MKVALAVYEFKNNDIAFNIKQIEKTLEKYAAEVDLICFAEGFLQGFDSLSWSFEDDRHIAVSKTGTIFKRLKDMTLKYQTAVAIGYYELDGSKIYSSYAIIENGETINNYRRISKHWKEYRLCDDHYAEGTCCCEFLYKEKLIKIALCGDMFVFPEKFKTSGILLWPIYVNFAHEEFIKMMPEYKKKANFAAETTLIVNALSQDPKSIGNAFEIVNGRIVSELGFGKEGALIVEI